MATIPESTKPSLEQRLAARARERWPQITEIRMRFRARSAYIDALVAGDAAEAERLPMLMKLCRLRYGGSAHLWRFAIYRASHDDYDESVYPSGLRVGTVQEALDTACGLYFNDPGVWGDNPRRI